MAKKVGEYFHYGGAIHIHTTESDGTKSIEEVVKLGQEVGLDFMMFADHNTLSNRDNGKEKYYDKTLVLVGYEHNDLNDKHHYLIFDSSKVFPSDMHVKDYVAEAHRDNAIGIMAHPDEIRDHLPEYPAYPWVEWDVDGFTGLELWNQMSEWMEKLTRYNKIQMTFSPRKSIVAPTDRVLLKWDELSLKRKYLGIAGVDAHAFPVKVGPLTLEIFPYKVHFKTLRTYLVLSKPLSENFESAKRQVYTALKNCNVYFSNVRWGEASDFEFSITGDSEKINIGGTLNDISNAELYVRLPSKADIKVIRNGSCILTANSSTLRMKISEKGIYRVEVWKRKRGWIFSNHIRVGV